MIKLGLIRDKVLENKINLLARKVLGIAQPTYPIHIAEEGEDLRPDITSFMVIFNDKIGRKGISIKKDYKLIPEIPDRSIPCNWSLDNGEEQWLLLDSTQIKTHGVKHLQKIGHKFPFVFKHTEKGVTISPIRLLSMNMPNTKVARNTFDNIGVGEYALIDEKTKIFGIYTIMNNMDHFRVGRMFADYAGTFVQERYQRIKVEGPHIIWLNDYFDSIILPGNKYNIFAIKKINTWIILDENFRVLATTCFRPVFKPHGIELHHEGKRTHIIIRKHEENDQVYLTLVKSEVTDGNRIKQDSSEENV